MKSKNQVALFIFVIISLHVLDVYSAVQILDPSISLFASNNRGYEETRSGDGMVSVSWDRPPYPLYGYDEEGTTYTAYAKHSTNKGTEKISLVGSTGQDMPFFHPSEEYIDGLSMSSYCDFSVNVIVDAPGTFTLRGHIFAYGDYWGCGGGGDSSVEVMLSKQSEVLYYTTMSSWDGFYDYNIIDIDSTFKLMPGVYALQARAYSNWDVSFWVSDYGDMVSAGGGSWASYNLEFIIPEPATLSLLGMGGLALLRNRREGSAKSHVGWAMPTL